MKTDLRIVKTQKNIERTMASLLKSTDFEKITVRQLCKEAQINRKTFYSHYMDKYDLVEKMLEKEVQGYTREWLARIDMVNNLESVDVVFSLMNKSTDKYMPNIEFYRRCLRKDFSDILYKITYDNLDRVFDRFSENTDNDKLMKHVFTWTSVGYTRYLLENEPVSFIDYFSKVSKSAALYVESFEHRYKKQKA